jgi:hypothetical protein
MTGTYIVLNFFKREFCFAKFRRLVHYRMNPVHALYRGPGMTGAALVLGSR